MQGLNTNIPALPAIRVLLVDDSALLREGIRAVLEDQRGAPNIQIVGDAGTVREAVERARALRPDVVLLDLRLPDGYGFAACREIVSENPAIRVLVLTSSTDDGFIYDAISAGAHGYVTKEIDPVALTDAIRKIAAGESVIEPELVTRMMAVVRSRSQQSSSNFTLLSPQEKRVLELVVQGRTNKEIGERLGLSENTVKNYLANSFEKLNVRRRSQAAAMYLRHVSGENKPKRA